VATIERAGIRLDLPTGWEGRIYRRAAPAMDGRWQGMPRGTLAPVTANVLQAANFALPPDCGDYGGGAVEAMQAPDVLAVVLEFDPAGAGQPLFAGDTTVPAFAAGDFQPDALQRVLPGQAGAQRFFTAAGRAFCAYVVLGSYTRRFRTVPMVNTLLAGLAIQ
jgi:hypothetical protein